MDDGGALGRPIPTLGVNALRAVIVATHARRKLAVVHVSSQREAIAAIEACADGLAHVFFDAAPTPAFVQLAAHRSAGPCRLVVCLAELALDIAEQNEFSRGLLRATIASLEHLRSDTSPGICVH